MTCFQINELPKGSGGLSGGLSGAVLNAGTGGAVRNGRNAVRSEPLLYHCCSAELAVRAHLQSIPDSWPASLTAAVNQSLFKVFLRSLAISCDLLDSKVSFQGLFSNLITRRQFSVVSRYQRTGHCVALVEVNVNFN